MNKGDKVLCIKQLNDSGLFVFQHYREIGEIGAITEEVLNINKPPVTYYYVKFSDGNIEKLTEREITNV